MHEQSNKITMVFFENDLIEIFYNELLTKKPYLIRLTNYNNQIYEIRADKKDIEQVRKIINKLC